MKLSLPIYATTVVVIFFCWRSLKKMFAMLEAESGTEAAIAFAHQLLWNLGGMAAAGVVLCILLTISNRDEYYLAAYKELSKK